MVFECCQRLCQVAWSIKMLACSYLSEYCEFSAEISRLDSLWYDEQIPIYKSGIRDSWFFECCQRLWQVAWSNKMLAHLYLSEYCEFSAEILRLDSRWHDEQILIYNSGICNSCILSAVSGSDRWHGVLKYWQAYISANIASLAPRFRG